MDNTLTIQLFFFATAVPVALEAYKAQGRARIALWAVAAIFGFTGFVWPFMSDRLASLQTAVEQIASNPTAWFVLMVALFFVLRPYWKNTERDPVGDELSEGQPRELREIVEKHTILIESQIEKRTVMERRLEKIDGEISTIAEDRKAIISDYQRMCGLEARLTEQVEAIEAAAKDYTKGRFDALNAELGKQAAEAVGLSKGLTESLDEQRSLIQEQQVAFHANSEATRFAIMAIFHREILLSIASRIENVAEDLTERLSNGKELTDSAWDAWQVAYQLWIHEINQWGNWAVFYLGRDPMNDIQRLHPSDYDGDWAVKHHQFPDPEAIRVYKTFRIFLKNWQALSEVVHQRVRMQAFEGMQTAERELINAKSQ